VLRLIVASDATTQTSVSTVQKTSTTGKANPSNRRRGAAFTKKDSSMPKKRLIEMDDILGGLE
jgi:hypothetical protein